jgi:hypothetical protein
VDAVKIDSAQNVTVSAGNLVIGTSGKGIDFSATPGTGTSELLADYEEGTWTPSVGGTATYTTQTGTYTRVGRVVFVTGRMTILLIGTGSTSTISGLPFTVANTSDTGKGTVGFFSNLSSNIVYMTLDSVANTTTIRFSSLAAAGATATSGGTLLTSTTRIDFSLTYMTE